MTMNGVTQRLAWTPTREQLRLLDEDRALGSGARYVRGIAAGEVDA